MLRRDHPLASRSSISLAELADETLLLHPREANPGHYDAVMGMCRDGGVGPRVLLRTFSFDLRYSPIVHGDAVAIVGESTTSGLPDERADRHRAGDHAGRRSSDAGAVFHILAAEAYGAGRPLRSE